MGYTTTGGPKGLGQFNNTPQTTSDLNKAIELIARMGNYRGGMTESERDLIAGDARYDGLMIYNQDTGELNLWDGELFDWRSPTSGAVYGPDSMGPNWSEAAAYPINITVVGDRVDISGAVIAAAGASFDNILTVPPNALASGLRWVGTTFGQSGVVGALNLSTSGILRLTYRTGSIAAGQTLPLTGSWYRN